jgi:hypothetical protein
VTTDFFHETRGLATADEPAHDLIVIRPVEKPYVAVLAVGAGSDSLEQFHQAFQESLR